MQEVTQNAFFQPVIKKQRPSSVVSNNASVLNKTGLNYEQGIVRYSDDTVLIPLDQLVSDQNLGPKEYEKVK